MLPTTVKFGEPVTRKDAWRLPAEPVERAVRKALIGLLRGPDLHRDLELENSSAAQHQRLLDRLDALIRRLDADEETGLRAALTALSARIEIRPESLMLSVSRRALLGRIDPDAPPGETDGRLETQLPLLLRKRGIETKLVLGELISMEPDRGLVKLVANARTWAQQLLGGEHASVRALAGAQRLDHRYVARALPFAFLAPDIVEAILEGRQPDGLSVTALKQLKAPPLLWEDQRQVFGFNGVD